MALWLYPFVVALVTAFLVTPLMKLVAQKFGILKKPNARSVHTTPVAQLGGVAIFVAFALSSFFYVRSLEPAQGIDVGAVIMGSGLMMLLGVIDDLRPLSAKTKFAGQVLVALLMVRMGIRIEFVTNPFGGLLLMGKMSTLVSVMWIVSFANVVNIIDGIDGLAAGVSTIAAMTLLFVGIRQGQAAMVVLTAALGGAALGFLRYNFNPAKIIMGDAGALFLGCALAGISIEGTLKSAAAVGVLVPVLALGVPIMDTAFAIVRRLGAGKPIGQADRGHLHHRLLDRGMSQKQTCFIMYAFNALLGLFAVGLSVAQPKEAVVMLGLIALVVFFVARRSGILETGESKVSARQ